MKSPLRLACLILAGLAVFALLLLRRGSRWNWEDLGLNLLTETVGIAVTLFFIELAFRAQEKAREQKYILVVHRRLRTAFAQHVRLCRRSPQACEMLC